MELLFGLLFMAIIFGGILGAIVAVVRLLIRATKINYKGIWSRPDRNEDLPIPLDREYPDLKSLSIDDCSRILRELTFPYQRKLPFLSRAERSFYGVLKTVADARGWDVFAKVRLEDLVEVRPRTEGFQACRNRIKSRHVDFLVCDGQTVAPLVAIELNDSTHLRDERQDRDAFVSCVLNAAAVPLVVFPVQRAYSVSEIVAGIDRKLGNVANAAAANGRVAVGAAGGIGTRDSVLCPRCGSTLVERQNRKTGERFLGCSNYPACYHMQSLQTATLGNAPAHPSTHDDSSRQDPDTTFLQG